MFLFLPLDKTVRFTSTRSARPKDQPRSLAAGHAAVAVADTDIDPAAAVAVAVCHRRTPIRDIRQVLSPIGPCSADIAFDYHRRVVRVGAEEGHSYSACCTVGRVVAAVAVDAVGIAVAGTSLMGRMVAGSGEAGRLALWER